MKPEVLQKSRKTKIVSLLTVSLLGWGGIVGCGSSTPASTASNQAIDVKTYTVTKGVMASGKVVANDEIQVASKLAGRVAAVNVQEGMHVEKGQVLVELDSKDYLSQVQQAQSAVQAAEANYQNTRDGARPQEIAQLQSAVDSAKVAYENAQTNFERTKNLYASGAVPKSSYDDADLKLQSAKATYEQAQQKLSLAQEGATANQLNALQAQVNQARAALQAAQNVLSDSKIVAPISGVVTKKNIDAGEMASPSVPLLTLVNLDEAEVQVSVPDTSVSKIKAGDSAIVHISSLGDKQFTGTVSFVSPIADTNSSLFPVKVKLPNPDGTLKSGLVAEVQFVPSGPVQLEIPVTTVLPKDGKLYVFKVNGDKAQMVEFKGKQKDANWYTVDSGVSESDKLVIRPSNLQDGVKVRVN
ncbi:efflux RND transporter periplasmic adaptor subunit [Effusibacillus dendaii]|uniref:Secretion protein HlyD n=1 Tax=Effusibacillus dendaii TaxID=2743772 RepID=A0A7I8DIZ5_9BACL|nr:efflux RND transporter periplasmic adaptor subunit [Effusibacillus dendaii]BCJ87811.1 secretion protein HlyD [Effusibacillus dendaii]